MPATGDDPATLSGWVNDLTFAEAHAMIYGGVHGLATVFAYTLGTALAIGLLRDLSVAFIVAFVVLNGWAKTERTKQFPFVSQILGAFPPHIKGQIRQELHYYDGVYVLAVGVAAAISWVAGLL